MGTLISKDTRRISFDNTFALTSALPVQKSIENDNTTIELANLATEGGDELFFLKEPSTTVERQEDTEVDYWAHRIDCLKKEHQLINKIIEKEYEKAIVSTNTMYDTPTVTYEKLQKMKPCFDWRSKILQCYEVNSHQPLACSAIVQAFNNCVTSCRMED